MHGGFSGSRRSVVTRLERSLGQWPAAAAILLIFGLGILWGIWFRLDLVCGDTSSYFYASRLWMRAGRFTDALSLVFSPLYCAYYAQAIRAFSDAGVATIVHRVVLLLATSVAILAVGRRVLPRIWAWLLAAWWIALPINWGGMFEVHLFGFCLLMIACACAGASRSAWARGAALALLATDALLVRNELLLAVGCFGLLCLVEIVRKKTFRGRLETSVKLVAPVLMAAVFALVLFGANIRDFSFSKIRKQFVYRERANFVQVYAFNYQQRHPEWKGDPWVGGEELLVKDFGRGKVTFSEALGRNPRAWMEYVMWNVSLVPKGLQLAMFSGYAGSVAPDWGEWALQRFHQPGWIMIIPAVICGIGMWQLLKRRRIAPLFQRRWTPALWTWLFLLSCVPTSLAAIVTQRPRASYIYPLTLLLMLVTTLSVRLLAGKLCQIRGFNRRLLTWIPEAIAVGLLFFLPGSNWPAGGRQSLLQDYERVKEHQALFTHNHVFCTNRRCADKLVQYICVDPKPVKLAAWADVRKRIEGGDGPEEALLALGITELYLDRPDTAAPELGDWRQSAVASGNWRALSLVHDGARSWEFWSRIKRSAAPSP